ncbi:MAG: hypothetical protein FJX76_08425 [Armatimonadetes bacterium]|nr:hypothetical protein [Armatimonadota bacterium]
MRPGLILVALAAALFAAPLQGLAQAPGPGYAQAPAPPPVLRLDNGTPLIVTPVQEISSAVSRTGDAVAFTVIHKCRVDGQILIMDGTPVSAVVADARHSQMFGRPGMLEITFLNTSTIDGSPLRVRAAVQRDDNTIGALGAQKPGTIQVQQLLPYGLGFAFNGKDAVMKTGVPITIFVDEDVDFAITPGSQPRRLTRPWVPSSPEFPTAPGGQFP